MHIDGLIASLSNQYARNDRELIRRAYQVAEQAHHSQKRASGEPYVIHCLAVAYILSEFRVPPAVVAAGLLHDTVEDTEITLEYLRVEFGEEIARLVDGVTKLSQLPRVSRGDQQVSIKQREDAEREQSERRGLPDPDQEAETLRKSRKYHLTVETWRKTFLAMADDPRVVLIKMADRLHNMRTLQYMPEIKQRRIAQETLDLFSPLANRLGIWQIKWELEDLGFRYVNPDRYHQIAQKLAKQRSARERQMQSITRELQKMMSEAGIQAEITGRPKHIYSIYRKMKRKGVPFEMIYDVRGVRIIVPEVRDCYAALGVIHTRWRPIPNEFDDYIASPKDNFYRSLHTAVKYDDGKTVECQIRTIEMHKQAEFGIAAHWRYKEGGSSSDADYERRIDWLRQMMEWRMDVEDAAEFVDSMKSDVFGDRVFAFTPRGDIIDLPAGSTPIDFAYHIHTDVGHRCRGAKVNGRLVNLGYILKTGDEVSIITAKRGGPSRDWLNPNMGLVNTQRARSKIKRWFKEQNREKNLNRGRDLLEKEFKRLGVGDVNINEISGTLHYKSPEDLYEALGCGDAQLGKVINQLHFDESEQTLEPTKPVKKDKLPESDSIYVVGLKNVLTNLANCCNPVPGDEIVGYITRGRGATIHVSDCPNVVHIREKERLVHVSWGTQKQGYPVAVRVTAYDRDGLMRDVSTVIADEGIGMPHVAVDVGQGNLAVFDLVLEVRDVAQLSRVLTRIERVFNVVEARRIKPG